MQKTDSCLLKHVSEARMCETESAAACRPLHPRNKVRGRRQEATHTHTPINQPILPHTYTHGEQQCYDNNSEFYSPL